MRKRLKVASLELQADEQNTAVKCPHLQRFYSFKKQHVKLHTLLFKAKNQKQTTGVKIYKTSWLLDMRLSGASSFRAAVIITTALCDILEEERLFKCRRSNKIRVIYVRTQLGGKMINLNIRPLLTSAALS